MDAHALLTSQGWRGTGHSLHPTSDTTGLSRPLLVSRKQNTLGVGKKQHKTSDMWWMNAFDSSLKGLDTSKEGLVVQTITSGGLDMVARGGGKYVGKGGLYASFVRGECLSGTITPEEREVADQKEKGRKGEEKESKEEKRRRKAEKRAAAAAAAHVDDGAVKESEVQIAPLQTDPKTETKEERRARKGAKRVRKEQESSADEPQETSNEMAETKEKRKARRRLERSVQEEKTVAEDLTEKPKKKKRRKE